jgi:hypothetical protein
MSFCEDISDGYELKCRRIGGVHYAIFFQLEHIEDVTIVDGEVTAIDVKSGERGWKIAFEEETSTFEFPPLGSRENGTYRVEQNLTVVLNDSERETRNLVNVLAQHRLFVLVVENDGKASVAGLERGLMLADGAGGTGTSKEDRNGFESLPFTGTERGLPPVLSENLFDNIEDFLIPAS